MPTSHLNVTRKLESQLRVIDVIPSSNKERACGFWNNSFYSCWFVISTNLFRKASSWLDSIALDLRDDVHITSQVRGKTVRKALRLAANSIVFSNSKSAFLVPFDAPSLLLIGLMCHFLFPVVEKVTASAAKRLGAHSFTARTIYSIGIL